MWILLKYHVLISTGSSSTAYIAAILITLFIVIAAIVTVVFLHQRLNILVPLSVLCPSSCSLPAGLAQCFQSCWSRLPTLNLFGVRSGRSRMRHNASALDDDDDDDPIA